MGTPETVVVHLGPDRFTVGYYMIEGNELQMIGPHGDIVRSHTLRPDDNVKAIASVLTKEIRKQFRGDIIEGFSDPLVMPEIGIA